jgi:glutamate-1-semialdehyde 2,1-aminomutase
MIVMSQTQTQNESATRSYDKTIRALERAENVIPLGTQTFSKSHLNFVRGAFPMFLDRGDGARVWDVDGNEYIDFLAALMPVVLGYNDADVNQAVINQLSKGISFSFATELEAQLAEKLIELIPSAEMVRFGKNGSDATAYALRVARAYTGREKIAVCGYHAWHDWYICNTPFNLGVPKQDKNLIESFKYNDLDSLEDLLKAEPDAYAAIMMEPANAQDPAPGFLEDVKELAEKYGALLVYDEICSGWRPHLGGAQAYYGVTPHLSCFGKAMGNGMPIAALVGQREYMQIIDKLFLSSTFGGETLSIAASIATINKMQKTNTVAKISDSAEFLTMGINAIQSKMGMDDILTVGGVSWWPRLMWGAGAPGDSMLAISLLRQELAEQGILIGSTLNMMLSHTQDDVKHDVLSRWEKAMAVLKTAFESPDPSQYLRGKKMSPPYSVR